MQLYYDYVLYQKEVAYFGRAAIAEGLMETVSKTAGDKRDRDSFNVQEKLAFTLMGSFLASKAKNNIS